MSERPGMHICPKCGCNMPSTPFCPKCGRARDGSNDPKPPRAEYRQEPIITPPPPSQATPPPPPPAQKPIIPCPRCAKPIYAYMRMCNECATAATNLGILYVFIGIFILAGIYALIYSPPVNGVVRKSAPASHPQQPMISKQPQATPWLLGETPKASASANKTLLTPAQKLIEGTLHEYGNIDRPARFMSTRNYRRPGMKIYTNGGVNTYELWGTYISSEGEYNRVVFTDGATNTPVDAFVDTLVTDYVAPD